MSAPHRSADPRGFSYALAPLQSRQQWRLDALITRLAVLRRQMTMEEGSLSELRKRQRACSKTVSQALRHRLDPVAYRDALQYLVRLQHGIDVQVNALHRLCRQAEELQRALTAQQLRLDLLARHRGETVSAWLADASLRQAAQADRDWLARHPTMREQDGED